MGWREHPDCPADGSVLCAVRDIPDQGGYEVTYGPEHAPLRILFLRRSGAVWAYEICCPHFSLPLNFDPQTFVTLDGIVMCAHHTAFFRFEDGTCVDGPCAGAGLTPIPVRCDAGYVHLALDREVAGAARASGSC